MLPELSFGRCSKSGLYSRRFSSQTVAEAKLGVGVSDCKTPCWTRKGGAAKVGRWIYGYLATNISNLCLISADFPRNCTFSHPSWMQGDCVPSTNMGSTRQGWSIRSHRFGVATGLGELLHTPIFSAWHMCSWSHSGAVRFAAPLLPHQQARWI